MLSERARERESGAIHKKKKEKKKWDYQNEEGEEGLKGRGGTYTSSS
jgi:hypothetical protein